MPWSPPATLFTLRRLSLIGSQAEGDELNDSVAVDAKRILLRYGAPISVLDKVPEKDRIEFAREIARTTLAEREPRLKKLLRERGYLAEG